MESAAIRAAPAPASTSACAPARAYAPRRPQASPLYRLLADHFETLKRVHEERYEPAHGPLRPVVSETVGKFLDCGLLEHEFVRVRCTACRAEFLMAFRGYVAAARPATVPLDRLQWKGSGGHPPWASQGRKSLKGRKETCDYHLFRSLY